MTRKITRAVARIKAGLQTDLYLGNLDAIRDWGYAPEYVLGMWQMLQVDEPDDFVLATSVGYTIRDFLDVAFGHVGLDWHEFVKFDSRYLRPAEVDALVGDSSKARNGWGGRRLSTALSWPASWWMPISRPSRTRGANGSIRHQQASGPKLLSQSDRGR